MGEVGDGRTRTYYYFFLEHIILRLLSLTKINTCERDDIMGLLKNFHCLTLLKKSHIRWLID